MTSYQKKWKLCQSHTTKSVPHFQCERIMIFILRFQIDFLSFSIFFSLGFSLVVVAGCVVICIFSSGKMRNYLTCKMRSKDKGETANTHTQWLWNGKKQEEAADKKWLERWESQLRRFDKARCAAYTPHHSAQLQHKNWCIMNFKQYTHLYYTFLDWQNYVFSKFACVGLVSMFQLFVRRRSLFYYPLCFRNLERFWNNIFCFPKAAILLYKQLVMFVIFNNVYVSILPVLVEHFELFLFSFFFLQKFSCLNSSSLLESVW